MNRLIFLLTLLVSFSANGAEPVLLGVLDEPQCGEVKTVGARIMFAKEGPAWKPVEPRPETANAVALHTLPVLTAQQWTIAFDGKNLGSVTLKDSAPDSPKVTDGFYKRDKRYVPVGKIPRVSNPRKLFEGWCGAPLARPLVLVSAPNFADPAAWKRFSPGLEYKQKLSGALRSALEKTGAISCGGGDGAAPRRREFGPAVLKIYDGYRSATDGVLISIGVDPGKDACGDSPQDADPNHWFLIRGEKVDLIGSEMELVDSGDYDGDGKSELLFWHSAYNQDGYRLLFGDLGQMAEYLWSYH
jgi:hypothetical protein